MKRHSDCWTNGALLVALAAVLVPGCITGTEEPSFVNPFDPVLGEGLPVPDSLIVAVGDNLVRLTWGLPDDETADEYAVFRKRTDEETDEQERLLERVSQMQYMDSGVRNGRSYAYRIAAGRGGQFGRRTEEIDARPGLFPISISGDETYTNTRDVTIRYEIQIAEAIQLSEDPDEFTEPWHSASGASLWTLSPDDGEKTVYARFRLADGSETLPVFDTIELDTRATIVAVTFDGAHIRRPGERIHFRLLTDEPHGTASVTVDGVFDAVPLFDDGSNGDASADDGIYERDLVIPMTAAINEKDVRGAFTDAAGNTATSITASDLLTIRQAPEPVSLLAALVSEPPDEPAVTLRWSLSQETDFSAYTIFRSDAAPVDSASRLIQTVTSASTLTFEDTDVVEGRAYHYRVYVKDGFGLETGSNTVRAFVTNLRPPDPVNVETPTAVSPTRIALAWTKSQARDFMHYRIYRNETGAVSSNDPLLIELSDVDRTYWDDTGLQENTEYYYRIYVSDEGGLSSRSDEVKAVTSNDPPPAVTLNEASAVDSTAATLSWTASTAHDFAFYRLYRDEIATVTTSSTKVVEMDDEAFTSFRDTKLSPGTRYYYRVFVVDDADEPASTGSNTVTLVTLETPEVQR